MIQSTAVQRTDKVDRLTLAPQEKSLLVIEDDLSLVNFLEVVLDEIQPDLIWEHVTSGEEAIEVIKRRGRIRGENPFGLVIADIFLEGEMTGFDVWLDCQQLYPTMPFVITSCLTFDRYFSILRGVNNYPLYLPKPLTVSRCQSVIQEYF